MIRVPAHPALWRTLTLSAALLAGAGDAFSTEAIPPDPLDAEAIPPDPVPDGLESTAPVRDGRPLRRPARRPATVRSTVLGGEHDPFPPFPSPDRSASTLPPRCRSRLPPDFVLGARGTIVVADRTLAAETVTAIDPDTCYLGAWLPEDIVGVDPLRWFNPSAIEAYSRD